MTRVRRHPARREGRPAPRPAAGGRLGGPAGPGRLRLGRRDRHALRADRRPGGRGPGDQQQPGRGRALRPDPRRHSLGELAMTKVTVLYAVILALMFVVVVRRHTRTEEESGHAELLAGTAIGRDALLAGAVVEGVGAASASGCSQRWPTSPADSPSPGPRGSARRGPAPGSSRWGSPPWPVSSPRAAGPASASPARPSRCST